jgi:hypothetical protein
MRVSDRVQLLSGPYTPPALKRGDRSTCLYRDADVVITSWTAAPISWPRCRRLECGLGQRSGQRGEDTDDRERNRAGHPQAAPALLADNYFRHGVLAADDG